eukprot:TRINITY_DN274_c0_g1_i5.p1 TRINITY_DN274_c0_g1~~TRINITY_DN274_c0_g1_i5.p1  ORF type:complete len:184 (-),score=10.81 TRINITY_DN274_c0_g1_i5:157-708(-)
MHNFERHVAGTCHVAHVLGSRTWHQLTPAVPLPRGAPPDERHVACVRRHATWRFLEKHNVALIEVEAPRGSSMTRLPEAPGGRPHLIVAIRQMTIMLRAKSGAIKPGRYPTARQNYPSLPRHHLTPSFCPSTHHVIVPPLATSASRHPATEYPSKSSSAFTHPPECPSFRHVVIPCSRTKGRR